MLFGRIKRPEPDAIEVIIGPRATFNGDLRCDTSIRIDGAMEKGSVETPANVVLTETARVQANIRARTVSIRGIYKGTLQAERLELLEGAQIYGTLHVNSFYMDDGVLLQAELNIQGALANGPTDVPSQPKKGSIPLLSRKNPASSQS